MDLHVGDIVQIKTEGEMKGVAYLGKGREKYFGEITVVTKNIMKSIVSLDIDKGDWPWTDEMLIIIKRVSETETVPKQKEIIHINNKAKQLSEEVIENNLFIVIDGKTTICIPKDTPYGISRKLENDEYDKLLGNSLAYLRYNVKKEGN